MYKAARGIAHQRVLTSVDVLSAILNNAKGGHKLPGVEVVLENAAVECKPVADRFRDYVTRWYMKDTTTAIFDPYGHSDLLALQRTASPLCAASRAARLWRV